MSQGGSSAQTGPRMIPAMPTGENVPESERRVFKKYAEECPADWIVIHSLGIARHARKRWAEADFVVISAGGVLVNEVKGGVIRRREGVWYSNDLPMKEPPLHQVAGEAAAIGNQLREQNLTRGVLVEGAVLFPDVKFTAQGTDLDPDRIGDAEAMSGSLADWVAETLIKRAKVVREQHPNLELRNLAPAERERILKALAGDFDLRPSRGSKLAESRGEMIRLTEEQRDALDLARDNPRAHFTGGAGTGKTMLAREHAIDCAEAGEKVLLVVYNRALALVLREELAGIDNLDVRHFHGLVDELIEAGGVPRPEAKSDQDLFREALPQTAIEALVNLDGEISYDVLLVDEAQDLLYETALDLFDLVLKGGLDNGRWCFFHDPKQDIYNSDTPGALSRLEAAHPARKVLRLNCRNTKQIALAAAACSGREPEPSLPIEGPDVQALYFDEEVPDLRKQVVKTINGWIKDDGIDPSSIVILSKRSREKTFLAEGFPAGVSAELKDIARFDPHSDDNAVRFSTIHSFKGLEADAVLLLSVGDLEDQLNKDLLYVGLSRARLLLAVGVPERQRERFGGLQLDHQGDRSK